MPALPATHRDAGAPSRTRIERPHLHWFRWSGHDPFSGSSLYACRCGVVRPGL